MSEIAIELNEDQVRQLEAIDLGKVSGESTRHVHVDAALMEQGLVERDETGELGITTKGRRLLRAQ